VEVDGETGRRSKVIEDHLEVGDRGAVRPAKDKGVVGILENRAREVRGERVTRIAISPGAADKALENVSDNDKEVRGEGIALPEAISAADPVSRDTVQEDGGVASVENLGHPPAPSLVKTTSFKDEKKAPPVDRVKSFLKVQLEDNGWGFPNVAAAEEVSRVDDVF
jgi:hypothetical protein